MPERIHKYLDEMDKLRDQAEEEIDNMLKKVVVKKFIQDKKNRKKLFRLLFLDYIKKNGKLFTKASKEGKKLAETL